MRINSCLDGLFGRCYLFKRLARSSLEINVLLEHKASYMELGSFRKEIQEVECIAMAELEEFGSVSVD